MAIRKRGDGIEVDVQVTLKGQKTRYRETIHGTFDEARIFEARVRADLLDGKEPAPFKEKAADGAQLPLEDALEKVWERYWANGGQARTVRSNMAVCVEFFGKDKCLSKITAADMDDFIIWMRQKDYAPSTIRQKACVMSKAFRHFHRRGNLSSIPQYDLPTIGDNTRDRVITDWEFQEVLNHCNDHPEWCALWVTLRDTGARPSELRTVKAADLRGDLLTLRETKSGKSRTVPLTMRALQAFHEAVRRGGDDLPFAFATPGAIRHKWDPIRERMGLAGDPGFIPYALRHTCATRLYAKTRDLMLVQRWMGHADIKMTLRYAKLQPGDLEKARDLLEHQDA